MLYPKNIETKLGFDKIRAILEEECKGPIGRRFVASMSFSNKKPHIEKVLAQTAEFLNLLLEGKDFPSGGFLDMGDALKKALIENSFLTTEEFFDLKRSLQTLSDCIRLFANTEEGKYPQLKELAKPLQYDTALYKEIDRCIDERCKVRDNASPGLQAVRIKIIGEQSAARKKLEGLLRNYKTNGFSKEDAELTIRNGRLVIPVNAESKRKARGLVHDKSATGQTFFMEPEEVIEINNEIKELEIQEREEVIKVLLALTDKLRPHAATLMTSYRFLGMLDFIRSKAVLAKRMDACLPVLQQHQIVEWWHVRHPLLLLSYKEQGKKVVSQNIKLDSENRILLISGPNAGGKSVCLKTAGLVQHMIQCGLLPPMSEASKICIFNDIFIDIGDEQSIENDLSTYSSHLTNMREFVNLADKRSLCLIDEFGTGTEPQLGAAIAESILERLNQKAVFGVITTHYANLKFLADKLPGLINGAMRYDVENLRPLYELEIGQPGSSFALEIAEKIGLPKDLLDRARKKLGVKQVNVENLLKDLEKEKMDLDLLQKEVSQKDRMLKLKLKEYTELSDRMNTDKKKILNQAKSDAKDLLKTANQKIEQAIKEIKEGKGENIPIKRAKKEIEKFTEELRPEIVEQEKEERKPNVSVVAGVPVQGDYVRIKGTDSVGEILEMKGKDALVALGELKSNIKISRLEKINKREYRAGMPKREAGGSVFSGFDMTGRQANFSLKLDLRGKRAEEALPMLDEFINDAILFNQNDLQIVHGKGDGILKELVRNQLKNYKDVKSYEDEHADRGGAGVTVIRMR